MKKNRLTCLVLILALSVGLTAQAQEQALYTQYMFNGLVINPAYSATDQAPVLTISDREQWVGLNGAPQTTTASFYTPVPVTNLSVGVLAAYDRLGVNSTFDGDLSAAYRIKLQSTVYMTLGLSLGIRSGISRLTDLETTTDPLLQSNESNMYGSVGLGATIYGDRFYVGISSPQVQGFIIREGDNGNTADRYIRHFYLHAAYLFTLTRNLDVKPNILVRKSIGAPVVDLNANFYINQVLCLGASYRVNESVSLIFQYSITPRLQIGYSYDYGITAIQNTTSTGSHEFMLSYRFINTNENIVTTRWF